MTTPLPRMPACKFKDMQYQRRYIGDVYTRDQMQAYATAARADLEAENKRLREALKSLTAAVPASVVCEDFHHPARDRHGIGGHCGPKARYVNALNNAIAALERKP